MVGEEDDVGVAGGGDGFVAFVDALIQEVDDVVHVAGDLAGQVVAVVHGFLGCSASRQFLYLTRWRKIRVMHDEFVRLERDRNRADFGPCQQAETEQISVQVLLSAPLCTYLLLCVDK